MRPGILFVLAVMVIGGCSTNHPTGAPSPESQGVLASAESSVRGMAAPVEVLKAEAHEGFPCVVGGGELPWVWTVESQHTETRSGGVTLSCRGVLPRGAAPRTPRVAEGFPCHTNLGITHDSREVISPSGETVLVCHHQRTT